MKEATPTEVPLVSDLEIRGTHWDGYQWEDGMGPFKVRDIYEAELERLRGLLEEAKGALERISDDFHPDSDKEAPLALSEMREAVMSVAAKLNG